MNEISGNRIFTIDTNRRGKRGTGRGRLKKLASKYTFFFHRLKIEKPCAIQYAKILPFSSTFFSKRICDFFVLPLERAHVRFKVVGQNVKVVE